ncbi:hypothetical protein [Verrucomicrobium spinosum]|nr:hypothetical protein [Verrucomicrobium spinosum]
MTARSPPEEAKVCRYDMEKAMPPTNAARNMKLREVVSFRPGTYQQ